MRQDSKGLPDVCRETFTKVEDLALDHVKYVKTQTNAMIYHLNQLQIANSKSLEIGRHLSLAISAYEEASMWAVKGLTTEGFKP